jgi:molecular chaperone DnaK
MTAPSSYRLAVDLGTSTTIAMLRWPDGRVRPLLFDGSPLLSSAVLLGPDGRLHVGRDAAHLARSSPERLEPNPKRRIDDDTVLLGDAAVPVRDLLGAILRRAGTEANRVAGPIGDLTLTYPAAWGPRRAALLADAAQRVGLPRPRLIGEPVAAATYFAHTLNLALPLGSSLLVYDLGAGTCDLTLLRRAPHGFDVVATDGLNDVGGLDVDAAIVGFLEASYGTPWTDSVSRRQVWDEVRTAKEMLSRASSTVIAMPSLGKEIPLGREQFNGLIGPVLRPTIAMTKSLLRDSSQNGGPTALVLVGGASRIPLVASLLYEAIGVAPIVIEQPELVVAEGALYTIPEPTALTAMPVSGGAGPAGPVSGSIAPVSGGFGPAAPVSGSLAPVSGGFAAVSNSSMPVSAMPVAPVSPVMGGPRPPTFVGPPHPAPAPLPPPAPVKKRSTLPIILAGVITLIVLGGGGAFALTYFNRSDQPNAAGSTPPSNNPTGTGAKPLKYHNELLPDNLCTVVDLGHLSTSFEKEATAPNHQFNVTAGTGVDSCTISRQHAAAVSFLTILYNVILFTDTNIAISQQKSAADDAAANHYTTIPLTGLGDEAFIAPYTVSSSSQDTTASYIAQVRDGNLRWTVNLSEVRSNEKWSDAERQQMIDDLAATVKATHKKLIS